MAAIPPVEATVPTYKSIHFYQFMTGAGRLGAIMAIVTANDWFSFEFANSHPSFVFFMLLFFPALVVQPLVIVWGDRFSFNARIIPAFITMAAVLAVFAPVVRYSEKSTGFAISWVFMFILGVCTSTANCSWFGINGCMPKNYTQSSVMGATCGGIFMNILRMIWLASFSLNEDGLYDSTMIYFLCCAAMMFVAAVCQYLMMKHHFVKYKIRKGEVRQNVNRYSAKLTQSPTREMEGPRDPQSPFTPKFPSSSKRQSGEPAFPEPQHTEMLQEEKPVEGNNVRQFIKDVWQFPFLAWLSYGITWMMFPGVATALEIPGLPYSWFSVLIVTARNVFETVGRKIPTYWYPSLRTVWIISIVRSIWFPVTITLTASDDPTILPEQLWRGTWFIILNVAMLGLTNGFLITMWVTMVPSRVNPAWKARAGYTVGTSILYGAFSGALCALAFVNVGHVPDKN